MAYFLKHQKQNNRTYLYVYESFYSPDTKGTKHRFVQSLGSIEKNIANGIDNPEKHYQQLVDSMNAERNAEKVKNSNTLLISDESPCRYLGYFPLAHILNTLDVKEYFDMLQSTRRFHFSIYDVFTSLVFARAVEPCSKLKTYVDVLPYIFKEIDFSYDQCLDGVEFLGSEYERLCEILNVAVDENYGLDTSKGYFDCTNFYFEIDKEDGFRKKGPSKENRKDPIVGMGLLLDANMIPIGMKMYPGNESEKPVLRDIISDLKARNNINSRTIQIADKGLNCARNIIEAKNNCDGYLFSKSVKKLSEKEQNWVLNMNDAYYDVYDKNGELIYKCKSCIDEFEYTYKDDNGKKVTKKVKEKRLVTYNPSLARKHLIEIDRMVDKAKKMCLSQVKKSEFGQSGKYMTITDDEGETIKAKLNEEAIEKDRQLAGYNMLVTSEVKMSDEEIYNAYHNLWRIEESFRNMKSELDARPAFVQKEDTIKGHFFICYATVLLERILQFKIFDSKFSSNEIYDFMRTFKVVKERKGRYINIATKSDFIEALRAKLNHPVTNFYLTEKQISLMHTR